MKISSVHELPFRIPALHSPLELPRPLTLPIDRYIDQRDRKALGSLEKRAPNSLHQDALQDYHVMSLPGWGNFTFGARNYNYMARAAGHGMTHISVAKDGTVQSRGEATLIGSPYMSLTPEWMQEFKTVLFRLEHALKIEERFVRGQPKKYLFLGHSKGGLLTYLLACLVKSYKEGRLNEFVASLKEESGAPLLQAFPQDTLVFIAQKLQSSVFGTLGSPLHGIDEEWAQLADLGVFFLGFNKLYGDSAKYFEKEYIEKIHQMTGYAPNEVLDFVSTSELESVSSYSSLARRGIKAFARLPFQPLTQGSHLLFKGASRLISNEPHDGVVTKSASGSFEHHHHTLGTHLDQVEKVSYWMELLDFLIDRNLL